MRIRGMCRITVIDPLQWKLKDRLAVLKGVDRNSIFLGNGSDEAIDLVIRAFASRGWIVW